MVGCCSGMLASLSGAYECYSTCFSAEVKLLVETFWAAGKVVSGAGRGKQGGMMWRWMQAVVAGAAYVKPV